MTEQAELDRGICSPLAETALDAAMRMDEGELRQLFHAIRDKLHTMRDDRDYVAGAELAVGDRVRYVGKSSRLPRGIEGTVAKKLRKKARVNFDKRPHENWDIPFSWLVPQEED